MVDTNFIIFLVVGITLAIGIGVGVGMFANWFRGKILEKRALGFITGERDNVYNLDGERVHINKFKWKNREGKLENIEIPRLSKIIEPGSSFKENKGTQNKPEVSNY